MDQGLDTATLWISFLLWVQWTHSGLCGVELSTETTLDDFIADTRNMVDLMCQNDAKRQHISRGNPGRPKHLSKRYNITDSLTIQQRSRTPIELSGFCIQTNVFINHQEECDASYLHIFACQKAQGFFITVHPNLNAFINSMISTPEMTGTETMFLVHHILKGIGMRTCGLRNCAKLDYEYDINGTTITSSIPLIDLRSIGGKTSDWYAEFGYANSFRERIAREMARIHDLPHRNSSFGPTLCALWHKADKTDFHIAYQDKLWRFMTLKRLRDSSMWMVHFD